MGSSGSYIYDPKHDKPASQGSHIQGGNGASGLHGGGGGGSGWFGGGGGGAGLGGSGGGGGSSFVRKSALFEGYKGKFQVESHPPLDVRIDIIDHNSIWVTWKTLKYTNVLSRVSFYLFTVFPSMISP